MIGEISSFTGPFRFLSNFYPCVVELDDVFYPSVENAYQAAKTENKILREPFEKCTPGQAKKLGYSLPIRGDWEAVKEGIMFKLLLQKFDMNNPNLRRLLINTNGAALVEGNWWGDTFWGVCKGEGQNKLGFLLECIRAQRTKEDNKEFDNWKDKKF